MNEKKYIFIFLSIFTKGKSRKRARLGIFFLGGGTNWVVGYHMVVGYTTIYAISVYHHQSC